MIVARMATAMIVITNVTTAMASPAVTGEGTVPANGMVTPTIEPPMNPASAEMATSGAA